MTSQYKSEIIFCLIFAAVAGSILASMLNGTNELRVRSQQAAKIFVNKQFWHGLFME